MSKDGSPCICTGVETLGQRLRLERLRIKLKQSELSEKLKINVATQGRYERDASAPNLDYLIAFQAAGGDAAYVVTGQRKPASTGLAKEITAAQIDQVAKVCKRFDPAAQPERFAKEMRKLWGSWHAQTPLLFLFAQGGHATEPHPQLPLSAADRLRIERERLGFNQLEFSPLMGLSKHRQSIYERGLHSPDSTYLAKLAELGGDLAFLLTGQRTSQH